MQYAQIIKDKVNIIEIEPDKVKELRDAGLELVDISKNETKPQPGWVYNPETQEFSDPEEGNPKLYLHLDLTGGDGREPIGIKNDGVDAILAVATFRVSEDPKSTVVAGITDISWRVPVRNEQNQIYDIVEVKFTGGIASFAYKSTGNPDICHLNETDFEAIEVGGDACKIMLVGDSTFKVYRVLT